MRPRKYLRSKGESQAGGAGRSVLGDRRAAADEAPPGAAALPDGRAAALARQARPEIPSAAGQLAVQRPAGRWRGDRGPRGQSRPRSIFAAGLCRRLGGSAQSRRSRHHRPTGRRIRASRPAIGRAFAVRGDQRDRKSTRLNSSHSSISYAVFCLKKKKKKNNLLLNKYKHELKNDQQ